MASYSVNKVILIGNLTRDPELRYTPQGTAVCSFGLATNRNWTTPDGEAREEAEFHNIVAWRKLAEICDQLLSKGRKVYVGGRLQTRDWTGDDGVKRYRTDIVIDEMIALDAPPSIVAKKQMSKSKESQRAAVPSTASPPAPAQQKTQKSDNDEQKEKKDKTQKKENKEDINPDDIPF